VNDLVVQAIDSTRLELGGPAQSVPRLTNAMLRLGCQVALLCPDHGSDRSVFAEIEANCFSSFEALRHLHPTNRIALIHVHGIWSLFNHRVARVARRLNIPYAISPRGMLEPWALAQKRWKKRIAWWLYQKRDLQCAAMLHATATSEQAQFHALGLTSPTVVLPNGVELPQQYKRTASPEGHPRTVLYLGRIHPKKGLMMLAEAWSLIRPPGWRMKVVGPDSHGHLAQVQEKVQALGIASDWSFGNAVYGEEKSALFLSSDLFVLPTFSENFGIAVAEALAFGLPVLTTTGAPWGQLMDNHCGWWVEPSVTGLTDGLQSALACSSHQLLRMGQKGRAWVEREFAWPRIAQQMLDAYSDVPAVFRRLEKPLSRG
jgi:glycosyltransferase involved in cell wall biosynthesis